MASYIPSPRAQSPPRAATAAPLGARAAELLGERDHVRPQLGVGAPTAALDARRNLTVARGLEFGDDPETHTAFARALEPHALLDDLCALVQRVLPAQ
jgi:hypothetical protein